MSETTWRLKPGAEKRVLAGHPWVFSSDLAHSPRDLEPGTLVQLHGASGGYMAWGYGHPNSLIAFRVLSLAPPPTHLVTWLGEKLAHAWAWRQRNGLAEFSFRLVHGESDGLPGLVVDRFRLEGHRQAFVVQASTAGMDRLLPEILQAIEVWVKSGGTGLSWQDTGVVVAGDARSRILEGLALNPRFRHKDLTGWGAEGPISFLVQSAAVETEGLTLQCDLLGGQKTGFFFDQRANLRSTAEHLARVWRQARPERVRILDLCCYVGQWGAQLAAVARQEGIRSEVTIVDSSAAALQLAELNVRPFAESCQAVKADVLKDLSAIPVGHYDVVVCDPPAFIKKRKDMPTGIQAYTKLNREAMRRLTPTGTYVSCSCSGLLSEDDFRSALRRAAQQARANLVWVAHGLQGADHPVRFEFPEGQYLKAWLGQALTI